MAVNHEPSAAPTTPRDLEGYLAGCRIDSEVSELRPDYRAMLLVVDGLNPEATGSDAESTADELITAAEAHSRALLAETPVTELPHIAAWREAYRAFGAKPQRTRNSLEALTRRAESGLPRINALTDIYNAISVLHQVPLGGEDLAGYVGSAHLTRATGDEDFDTFAGGEPVIEHPEPGEVIWRDDAGVTCRRWNWRQGRRTALQEATTSAVFILDALAPMTDADLEASGTALASELARLGTEVRVASRLLGAQ